MLVTHFITVNSDNRVMPRTPHALDMVIAPAIIVATLNAKYIHASLGLRYLLEIGRASCRERV